MDPNRKDRDVLSGLGRQLAEAAAGQDRAAQAEMWRRNNDLDPVRTMVWITETPWHEFRAQNDELVCRCSEPWLRQLEDQLRCTLYPRSPYP